MTRRFRFELMAAMFGIGLVSVAGAQVVQDPRVRVLQDSSDVRVQDSEIRVIQEEPLGEVRVGEVRDNAEIRVGEVRDLRDPGTPVELGGSNARLFDVELREQVQSDGGVRGVVSNLSNDPVQDIQILVSHSWLWNNETNPGEAGPGRARYVTVPGLLPPGKSVEFEYDPIPPLPYRTDGRFNTTAEIVGFDRITYKTVPRGTTDDDRSDLR